MKFKKLARILAALFLALMPLLVFTIPVAAIGNPNSILFGCETNTTMYNVFRDVNVSGDWLIVAETYVHYTSTPTDYKSSEAFTFQLVDTDGSTVLFSTPLQSRTSDTAFEDYVNSIYLTAAQVSAAGLVWETAYKVRIAPNVAIFGTPVEGTNQRTATLQPSDYYIDTANSCPLLRQFLISAADNIATDLQVHDVVTYIVSVQGVNYLNTTGGTIFLDGIPALNIFCPSIFQTTTGNIEVANITSTGAYASTLTVTNSLGARTAYGISQLATWFGITSAMAGGLVLLILSLLVCGYAYVKTQSILVPDVIAVLMPLLGIYLGLLPMAIGFVAAIAIVLISVYYFLTRGSL